MDVLLILSYLLPRTCGLNFLFEVHILMSIHSQTLWFKLPFRVHKVIYFQMSIYQICKFCKLLLTYCIEKLPLFLTINHVDLRVGRIVFGASIFCINWNKLYGFPLKVEISVMAKQFGTRGFTYRNKGKCCVPNPLICRIKLWYTLHTMIHFMALLCIACYLLIR